MNVSLTNATRIYEVVGIAGGSGAALWAEAGERGVSNALFQPSAARSSSATIAQLHQRSHRREVLRRNRLSQGLIRLGRSLPHRLVDWGDEHTHTVPLFNAIPTVLANFVAWSMIGTRMEGPATATLDAPR